MSQYDEWDDDDLDLDEDEGRADALTEARRAQRKAAKRAKELEQELGTLRAQVRQSTIRDAIQQKGLNPKIAKLIPESVELDKLDEFIADFADLFGTSSDGDRDADAESGEEQVTDENAEALGRIAAPPAGARPPRGDDADMLAKIKGAQTVEELNLLIHGNSAGPVLH